MDNKLDLEIQQIRSDISGLSDSLIHYYWNEAYYLDRAIYRLAELKDRVEALQLKVHQKKREEKE